MLPEMHIGARPGRTWLLSVVTGSLLALTLGLAWIQVHDARALGPPQVVPGTPVRVRVPRDWLPSPDVPGRFQLEVARGDRRRGRYERAVTVEYHELDRFVAPEILVTTPFLTGGVTARQVQPALLGGLPAIEFRQTVPLAPQVRRERVVRFTCLPRGQVLKLTYEPLLMMRTADWEIFDDLCTTVRFEGAGLDHTPQEALTAAGLELPVSPGWVFAAPALEAVPGVHISGLIDGLPSWSLAIYRTWLAHGRTPQDLLADIAAENWLRWNSATWLTTARRADGVQIAALVPPAGTPLWGEPRAAWIVWSSPTEAVLLLLDTSEPAFRGAVAAVTDILSQLRILPHSFLPELDTAEAAGIRLARDLGRLGPVQRWGRAAVDERFTDGAALLHVRRRPADASTTPGYRGEVEQERRGLGVLLRARWELGARAESYEWSADSRRVGTRATLVDIRIQEERLSADGEVQRQLWISGADRLHFRFTPGPAFVPSPATEVVNAWVARQDHAGPARALVESTALLGAGPHTVLLRPLPPDGPLRRVLVQADYDPTGSIEAYDEEHARLEYLFIPGSRLQRVP
ncbi:MAG: hypothetical protein IPM18_14750 [Phycisphaerales bacterium]|nr:hypothetical protein [Phycisphaerales bacterium]